MKALYTTSPGDFGLVDRPGPEPGPGDAVVRVTRASICHTDVIIRSGDAHHVRYSVIPGHEFAGVVDAVGSDVTGLAPGTRVAAESIMGCGRCGPCREGRTNWCENYDELGSISDGGFAEYCIAPAEHWIPLPDHVDDSAAAMCEPLANAVAAVEQVGIEKGDRVMVIGPGPIGCLVLQVARLYNPGTLILAGTRDSRLAIGEDLGATHVVNVRNEGADAELRNILEGKGANAIIECAGTASAFQLALDHAGVLGRIAFEGVYGPNTEITFNPHRTLLERSVRMIGVTGWNRGNFRRAIDLFAERKVTVEPLVTQVLPLDEWETGFDFATNRKDESIKVQLEISA